MSDQSLQQEASVLRQRLEERQREFAVLQHAFTLVSAQNQAMQHLLRLVLHTPSLDEVLDRSVALFMDLMKAEAGSLLMVDHENQELYFRVARGPAGDAVKGFRVKMGEGIVGWVASENEVVAISDVDRDPRFKRDISQAVGYEVRSVLAVPFRLRGQLIGVYEILNKQGDNVFLADDRDMILSLANYLGLLLQLTGREPLE